MVPGVCQARRRHHRSGQTCFGFVLSAATRSGLAERSLRNQPSLSRLSGLIENHPQTRCWATPWKLVQMQPSFECLRHSDSAASMLQISQATI